MKNQKGFIPIVLAIVIGAIALGLVGASVIYKVENDKQIVELANSNLIITNQNVNTATETVYPIVVDWQDYHVGGMDQWIFYKEVNGQAQKITTPFNLNDYHGIATKYGAIFWKHGQDRKSTAGGTGEFTYEYGVDPDFQFYDYTEKTFNALPDFKLTLGTTTFERILGIYQSSTEPKLAVAIGEFDTRSEAFIPGMSASQPSGEHGIVIDLVTKQYINDDPITAYLEALDVKTIDSSGGGNGFHWDSQAEQAVAVPGGEGCGNYTSLIYVDLAKKTKTVVGGENSFTFKQETCNPKNRVSPDDYWFVLSGKSDSGKFDIYLFNQTSTSPVKQSLDIPNLAQGMYVQKWNIAGQYPVVTLESGQKIDFNTGEVINVEAVVFEEKGRVAMQGEPIDMMYTNGFVYVSDGWNGALVFNVQNPEAPSYLTTIQPITTDAEVNGVHIKDSYAFVSDSHLRIFDISDTAHPQPISTVPDISNPSVFGTTLVGNYAYVVEGGGLKGVDVTDVRNPRTFDVPGFTDDARDDHFQDNNRLYIRSPHKVEIVDLSNPALPTLAGTYNTENWVRKIFMADGKLHVVTGTMQPGGGWTIDNVHILNVDNPDQITEVGTYNPGFLLYSGGIVGDVIVENDRAYIARDFGVYVYNVSNFQEPKLLGYINGESMRNIVKNGNLLYVTSSTFDNGGYLYVYQLNEVH